MGEMNFWAKVFRNISSNALGTCIISGVGFILMPALVRHLGAAEYGIWLLVGGLVGYAGLLDLGLGAAVIKFSSEYLAQNQREPLADLVQHILFLYTLVGTSVFIFVALFAGQALHLFYTPAALLPQFTQIIWIVGFQTAIGFPFSIFSGLILGMQEYHIRNVIKVGQSLIRLVTVFYLIHLEFGLVGFVLADLVLNISAQAIMVAWVKRKLPWLSLFPKIPSMQQVRKLSRFSGAMFILEAGSLVVHNTDRVIIGMFVGAAGITLYEVGAKIFTTSRMLMYALLDALMPASSELSAKRDIDSLSKLFLYGSKYTLAIYCFISVPFILLGHEFIRLWMGDGFNESALILNILLVGSIWQFQNVLSHPLLKGMGHVRVLTVISLCSSLTNIALSLILVRSLGSAGVALGTTLTYFFFQSYFIFYVTNVFRVSLRLFLKTCHLPVCIALILSIVMTLGTKYLLPVSVKSWEILFGSGTVFAISYILSLWFFGTTAHEKEFLLKQLRILSRSGLSFKTQ